MTRSLREGVEALRGRHIALVGDFILDEYIYGDTVRVSREAPVPVVLRKSTEHRLGGAANTATNFGNINAWAFGVGTFLFFPSAAAFFSALRRMRLCTRSSAVACFSSALR